MKFFILPEDLAAELVDHLRKAPTGQTPYQERELLLVQTRAIREIPANLLPIIQETLEAEDESDDAVKKKVLDDLKKNIEEGVEA